MSGILWSAFYIKQAVIDIYRPVDKKMYFKFIKSGGILQQKGESWLINGVKWFKME